MPEQLWVAPLKRGNVASGTTTNSFTTFTSVSPTPDAVFPANFLTPGAAVTVKASGRFSSNGTPNITFGLYYGGVAGVQLCSTQPLATFTSAANAQWKAEFDITVRTEGSTGTAWASGAVLGVTSSTSAVVAVAGGGAAITIDTTAAKSLNLAVAFSVQHGSNQIIVDQWQVLV